MRVTPYKKFADKRPPPLNFRKERSEWIPQLNFLNENVRGEGDKCEGFERVDRSSLRWSNLIFQSLKNVWWYSHARRSLVEIPHVGERGPRWLGTQKQVAIPLSTPVDRGFERPC